MNRIYKQTILIIFDLSMIGLSMVLSQAFLDIIISVSKFNLLANYIVVCLAYLVMSYKLKIFFWLTRFTDYRALLKISFSLFVSYLLCIPYGFLANMTISYRFLIISLATSMILMLFPRLIWRAKYEWKTKNTKCNNVKKKTLIIGAGDGGYLFIKTIVDKKLNYDIVGIVDDDPTKHGGYIYEIRVIGGRKDIPKIVHELEVEQVVIAIPSLTIKDKEEILDICNAHRVKVLTMPHIEEILSDDFSTNTIKDIDIADLLDRPEIVLDQETIGDFLRGKTILVTGAGGSIGSEICRQVSKYLPKRLLLLGHGENSIYQIHRELQAKIGTKIEIIPLIADIQDQEVIDSIMATYRPNLVYHAAAHKHVPLMEANPKEAIKNNIYGTKNVAEAAKKYGVEKFVMVSTDKAVNPPNVMGATKRIAEMIVTALNENSKTQFVAVRFGNVLGSRGSVVPLFKEQISTGGPVTVTDFRMTRYFMTIPEASSLVVQASFLANGGEVFVLDMGEPVKIIDLAKKVIKLSGFSEDEIAIVESGIRPGEKLYEELLASSERVSNQVHQKIFVGRVQEKSSKEVDTFLSDLDKQSTSELKKKLVAFAKQE
ncbi:TPA: polysaccharide biosynthesis protein [Streptococcus suis]